MNSKSNNFLLKDTLNMAWPAVLESFFSAFVGLVDSYMVSTLGSFAVAAVGITTQPKFVGLSLFFALNVAISALVARRFGEKKRDDANGLALTVFLFVIAMAVVFSFIFVGMAPIIMEWCGSTVETHDMATTYFRIVMAGMIFNCVQMIINAAQRGAGNTRITMITNVTSNLINVIFNYLLIGGHFGFPKLGIAGAAIATVLGTVVGMVMSIVSICSNKTFISIPYMLENKIKPTFNALKRLVSLGYSVALEQLLMRIGFVATAVMAANQGNDAMAAHQVAMNLLGLSFSFGDGLQAAAVALIGRSLGQKDPELAKHYGATCRKVGFAVSIVLCLSYIIGANLIFGAFFDEAHIVAIGVRISRVLSITLFLQISQVIYMGALRGAGDTGYTAFASTISVTIVRTVVGYFCCYVLGWGIIGIWMGVMGDQLSRFIFSTVRYRSGKWTKIEI